MDDDGDEFRVWRGVVLGVVLGCVVWGAVLWPFWAMATEGVA